MSNLMRLDEAIRKKIVRNSDIMDPNALFSHKKHVAVLESRKTGMEKAQVIYRKKYDYIFFKIREKGGRDCDYFMVATNGPKVSLKGHEWYYSVFLFDDIDEMYSNNSNGISADLMNRRRIIDLILERNKGFKGFKNETWVDEQNLKVGYMYSEYVQKFIKGRKIMDKVLYSKSGVKYSACFEYCPIININWPSDILVVLDSKERTGKWKLIPKNNLLLRLIYELI